VGDVFGALDVGATAASRSIGIIGLGAGALATYERPGDSMTFYEIDPVVVRVALDPAFFTFLVDAPNHPTVVVGDARLSLGRVPAAAHDVLVLDAFSSDTIPVHLLTAEAFSEYARVMQPGGLLAIHVSNRYYDLAVPVASAARSIGLTPLVRSYIPTEQEQQAGAKPSIWVVATADADLLSGFRSRGWQPVASEDGPFTDDFANLLKYMRLAP
jgi:spermidine synthase